MKYFETGVSPLIIGGKKKEAALQSDHEKMEKFLAEMQENFEKNTIFNITFSRVDEKGNLEINVNGCIVHMKNAECVTCGNGTEYNKKYALKFLERTYNVIVTDIDKENAIVYVSHAKASRMLREHIMSCIKKQIKINTSSNPEINKNKQKIIMPSRIIDIDDEKRRVVVDIHGYRITGIITSKQWGKRIGATKMSEEVKVGEWIDVEILCYQADALKIGDTSLSAYICSRRTLQEGNWNGLNERYKKDTGVTVICRKKLDDYSFMGEIPGEEGIPVLCVRPRKGDNVFHDPIIRGEYYQGKVVNVDENAKRFKMRFFKRVEK